MTDDRLTSVIVLGHHFNRLQSFHTVTGPRKRPCHTRANRCYRYLIRRRTAGTLCKAIRATPSHVPAFVTTFSLQARPETCHARNYFDKRSCANPIRTASGKLIDYGRPSACAGGGACGRKRCLYSAMRKSLAPLRGVLMW